MGATASGKLALARFYDGTENDMTVREAFEKAGYPVPKGKCLNLYLWDYETPRLGYEDSCIYENDAWMLEDAYGHLGWFPNSLFDSHIKIEGLNMSNLPAKDAYDLLPDVVKEVVE